MKYAHYLKGTVLLLFLIHAFWLPAQERKETPEPSKKEERLRNSKDLISQYESVRDQMSIAYEAGEMHRVIQVLRENCLTRSGARDLTPDIKPEMKKIGKGLRSEIFEFAALAFLAQDQPEDAEYYVRKLFALNHAKDFSGYWLDIREAYSEVYYTAPRLSIGFGPATTVSSARVTQAHSIFDMTAPPDFERKTYEDGYPALAVNLLLDLGISKHLSVLAVPSYYGTGYRYKTDYLWTGIGFADFGALTIDVQSSYTHTNRLTYLDLPLMLRYKYLRHRRLDETRAQRLKPYVQAGAFGGLLLGADRSTQVSVIDVLAGTTFDAVESSMSFGVDTLFQSYQWGLTGSVGVVYEFDFMHLGLDLNYRYGMSQLIKRENRYALSAISHGVYDVPDEVNLSSLGLSLYLILPLAYKAYKK